MLSKQKYQSNTLRQQPSSTNILRNRLQVQDESKRLPSNINISKSQKHLRAYSYNDQQSLSQANEQKSSIIANNNTVNKINASNIPLQKFQIPEQSIYFRGIAQLRAPSRYMNKNKSNVQASQSSSQQSLQIKKQLYPEQKPFPSFSPDKPQQTLSDIRPLKLAPLKARHDLENDQPKSYNAQVIIQNPVMSLEERQKKIKREIKNEKRLSVMNGNNNSFQPLMIQTESNQFNTQSKSRNMSPQQNKQQSNDAMAFSQSNEIDTIACKTQAGKTQDKITKTNQDIFISIMNFGQQKGNSLFSVCDGHGVEGHKASGFIKETLPKMILQNLHNCSTSQQYRECLTLAFQQTDLLLEESSVDCTFSGSTCILTLMIGRTLYSANIGDSRIVVGKLINKQIQAVALSYDHKPDNPGEQKRIEQKGGRVQAYSDYDGSPIGPARVWLKDSDIPGLAMSRSFGDRVAQSCGVISEPEISVYELSDQDRFIVLASDGVWEFLSNQQVVDMVYPYYKTNQADQAGQRLVKESTMLWRQNDEVIDDITCQVIFLKR